MKLCAVVSTQRSGSTFFVDYLSDSECIQIYSELFQNLQPSLVGREDAPKHYAIAYETYRKSTLTRRLSHAFLRRRNVTTYLDEISKENPGPQAIGFKIMYNQIQHYPPVWDWLVERDAKFIHLVRKNALRVLVSRRLARARGSHSMLKTFGDTKIRIDTKDLLSRLSRYTDEVQFHRSKLETVDSIEVTYESIVDELDLQTNRVLDFLSVTCRPKLGSRLKKTNPDPLGKVIENFDDVERLVRQSRFAEFLE